MYVSVGSTCNVCNESSDLSATILTADANGGDLKVFAKGLRNAPFIQFNPKTQELWATEMGRDNLGDNIPPDEINIVKQGKDYGWPNCYGDKIADLSFNPNASCQNTEGPIYQIPAHSAPLGLAHLTSKDFPNDWQGDLLVSYHGSWNRSEPIGYKIVKFKVDKDGKVSEMSDFITGWLSSNKKKIYGRPVDLKFNSNGVLYISDDAGGIIYRVEPTPKQ
jgi:glucose/arabinose dehydrogenase